MDNITPEALAALHNALMSYTQADMDGVLCTVSRQAVHEAADIVEAYRAGKLVHVDAKGDRHE